MIIIQEGWKERKTKKGGSEKVGITKEGRGGEGRRVTKWGEGGRERRKGGVR